VRDHLNNLVAILCNKTGRSLLDIIIIARLVLVVNSYYYNLPLVGTALAYKYCSFCQ